MIEKSNGSDPCSGTPLGSVCLSCSYRIAHRPSALGVFSRFFSPLQMFPAIGRRQRRSTTHAGASAENLRNRPRPNSVDLDLQDLTQIRVTIQKDLQAKHEIIAQEHSRRQDLASEEERVSRQLAVAMKKSFLYARYQDVQRERRKHQENATRRIHELFDQCRLQERAEQQAAEEEKMQQRQRKTQQFKQSLESNLREYWRESEEHKSQLHDLVQRQREEASRRRAIAENEKLVQRHNKMLQSRQEQVERSRQRVAEKASERSEKRRHIQQTRAESCSPTLFMALPPMKTLLRRSTFVGTVEQCMEGGGDYRLDNNGAHTAMSSMTTPSAADGVDRSLSHRGYAVSVGIATDDAW